MDFCCSHESFRLNEPRRFAFSDKAIPSKRNRDDQALALLPLFPPHLVKLEKVTNVKGIVSSQITIDLNRIK